MIISNKLDNYFVVSADRQTFLGFEMTANLRDTFPLTITYHNFSLKHDEFQVIASEVMLQLQKNMILILK